MISELIEEIFSQHIEEWVKSPEKLGIAEAVMDINKKGIKEIFSAILSLLKYNMLLWDRESKIRKEENQKRCVELKRDIDHFNLQRNKAMEEIDQFYFEFFKLNEIPFEEGIKLPYNSETLGQILDRISILSLKKFYREWSGENREEIEKIKLQIRYLSRAFENYFKALEERKAYMINFKQFKKYENTDLITEEEENEH